MTRPVQKNDRPEFFIRITENPARGVLLYATGGVGFKICQAFQRQLSAFSLRRLT